MGREKRGTEGKEEGKKKGYKEQNEKRKEDERFREKVNPYRGTRRDAVHTGKIGNKSIDSYLSNGRQNKDKESEDNFWRNVAAERKIRDERLNRVSKGPEAYHRLADDEDRVKDVLNRHMRRHPKQYDESGLFESVDFLND